MTVTGGGKTGKIKKRFTGEILVYIVNLNKVRKLRKMPYIQPNGSGSGSKNGCGTVFMALIIVVALFAAAS